MHTWAGVSAREGQRINSGVSLSSTSRSGLLFTTISSLAGTSTSGVTHVMRYGISFTGVGSEDPIS